MGFYGNVKDIEKNSSFIFDKIYPNRQTMDYAAKTDNVYIGRYVLVEYDETVSNLDYKKASLNDDIKAIGGQYYILYDSTDYKNEIKFEQEEIISDSDTNAILDITYNSLVYTQKEGKNIYYQCVGYVVVTKTQEETDDKEAKYSAVIYLSDGSAQEISDASRLVAEMGLIDEIKYAVFQPITSTTDGIVSYSNYSLNYNIDVAYAKSNGFELTGHGWDSTVWQKTTVNGAPKYVMVAELNTVVPTFGLTIDAPTQTPLTPHFDSASTDVYYELHWQPQWGLRVKLADATYSSKQKKVPSDASTTWIRQIYDNTSKITKNYYLTENNGWREFNFLDDIEANGDGNLPAAIYYNKAGFNASNRYHSNLKDSFTIEPTGYSQSINDDGKWENTQYNNHLKGRKESAVDTQEISMILPSIGNAISDMWDIVYGTGTGNTANQENTSSPRLTSISWEQAPIIGDGNRLQLVKTDDNKTYSYSKTDVETLAGSINSVHDLMGMIIQDPEIEDANLDTFAENKAESDSIYYIKEKDNEKTGKFYRRAREDKYKQLNDFKNGVEKYQQVDANFTYIPNTYYKVKDGRYVLATESAAETGVTYYTFDEAESDGYIYELVSLNTNTYKDGTYYIKGTDGKFTKAIGDFDKEVEYYKKLVNSKMTKITFADTNAVMTDEEKGPYYIKTANEDYNKATVYSKGSTYYKVTSTDEGAKKFEAEIIYYPNTYYYKNGEDYLLDINSEPSADDEYSIAKDAENENKEIKQACDVNKIYRIGKYYSKNVATDSETKQSINYYKLDLGKWKKDTIYYNKNEINNSEYTKEQLKDILKEQNSSGSKSNPLIVYQIRTEVPVYLNDDNTNKLYSAYIYGNATAQKEIQLTQVWADEKVWSSDGTIYYHGSSEADKQVIDTSGEIKYYFEPKNKYTYSGTTESFYLFAGQGDSIDFDNNGQAFFYGKNPSSATEMTVNKLYMLTQATGIIDGVKPTADSKESQSGETIYYKLVDDNYIRCIGTDGLPDTTSGSTPTVYKIEFEKVNERPFYRSGIYYYQENNNSDNYIKDKIGNVFSATRTYYNITATVTTIDFGEQYIYEPGVYYYKKNNRYYIDNNLTYTAGRDYYTGANDYYVFEDEGKVLAAGAKWNIALPVRHGLSIGVRDGVKYSMQELVGFARTLNTIHGLILQINNFLEYNNENTRNTSTVQGVVNTLNDIIAKFEILDYGQFVVTDSYGRMHTAPAEEDRWIESYINPDVDNPTVHIHHTETNAEPDENEFDFNNKQVDEIVIHQLTPKQVESNYFSEKLSVLEKEYQSKIEKAQEQYKDDAKALQSTLDDLAEENTIAKEKIALEEKEAEQGYDSAGHILNTEKLTITLPYGFKTISTNGKGDNKTINSNTTLNTTEIVADNTQDILAINSGDQWIRINTDATNDTLVISHDIHTIDIENQNDTNLNTTKADTITIQDTSYDEAGHLTANKNHTYTLPYGFKTIKSDNKGSYTAVNTQDTLNITASDKWLDTNISENTNTLDITHKFTEGKLEESTQDQSAPENNTIRVAIHSFDEMGHKNASNIETITLPWRFKQVTGDTGTFIVKEGQTFAITTSDDWLKTSVDDTSGIVIAHEVAQKATTTKGLTQAATPNFGDSFVVPEIGIDDKGHTASLTEYSVTLPKVTIDPAETGNVVTGITINSTSGVITETKTNAGDIALGTYTTEVSNDDLVNTDTISSALNKLAVRLTTEVTNRASADNTVREEFAAADTSLKTTLENKISTEVTALNNTISSNKSSLETADSNLSSRITELENLNIKSTYATITTVNSLTNRVSTLEGYDIPNTYLSSSTAASTYLTKSDASSTYLTISSGDSYVLKSDYDALEKRVATLEETVEKLTSSSESETTT